MTENDNKVSNSRLRRMVFENIDTNQSGKIDNGEEQLGAIFGLKAGDKKIKKKGFNRNLAIDFLKCRKENKNIAYQQKIEGDADIEKCYDCTVIYKDIGVDIKGNENMAIVQHDDNHDATIDENGIEVSAPQNPESNQNSETIDLCVECEVNIVNDEIDIEGKNNTLVYQSDKKTVVVEDNTENIHAGKENQVNIEDCVGCNEQITNNHTHIKGNKNKVVTQYGNDNSGKINK